MDGLGFDEYRLTELLFPYWKGLKKHEESIKYCQALVGMSSYKAKSPSKKARTLCGKELCD